MNDNKQRDKYILAFWSMLGVLIFLVYLILKNKL